MMPEPTPSYESAPVLTLQPAVREKLGLDLVGLGAFYRAWGHRAVVAGGTLWFDGGALSMMSIPTALTQFLGDAEVRGILFRTSKLAAVYRVPEGRGFSVPIFMLRDKTYGLAHLQRQFRQHVERASSVLQARECTWKEWEIGALRCDRDTLKRHGSARSAHRHLLSASTRRDVAVAASAVPGLRIHACFQGNEIAAYLVHLTFGGVCEGLMSNRVNAAGGSVLRCASNLLYFSFAESGITRPEVDAVCVGRQSLPANEGLARFKRHAGFQPEPCFLRMRLHPYLAPFLENPVAAVAMRWLRTGLSRRMPTLGNLEVVERAGLQTE